MIIFPAVDIKEGKCVRLRQGKANESTVFMENPIDAAEHWKEHGAEWLHLIDLDGAFDGTPVNLGLMEKICSKVAIPVQVGGGIRDLDTARRYIDAGVTRVIIGTVALESPDLFASMCAALPGKVGVSLDADKGKLKTKGWVKDSGLSIWDVLPRLQEQGSAFIIYTDIERDGMQNGINFESLKELSEKSLIPVIAAGGVTTIEDIKRLYPLSKTANLQGAISGRAIYEGTMNLEEAQSWISSQS